MSLFEHELDPVNPFQKVSETIAALQAEVKQLKFILNQAPMIDAPRGDDRAVRVVLNKSRSPFAYIHPKTMASFSWGQAPNRIYVFPGSPTKWVLCSAVPEGRVLYSPLQIPGLERLLES